VNDADRHKLLFGPYQAPPLKRGDRAVCLYRDAEVVITGWSDARIAWPRCHPVGRGGVGLLVDEELARAVRHESALAVAYWWGVSRDAVRYWRRALGVGRADNEGTARLVKAASASGAAAVRGQGLPPEQVERRRRTAVEQGLGRYLTPGHQWPRWTDEDLALLGAVPDEDLAAKTGRTPNAVRVKRTRLGIPTHKDRRGAKERT
jgi:hypothetical protein